MKLGERPCPLCGAVVDSDDCVSDPGIEPKPGDVGICWSCRGLLIYTLYGTQRPATEEEARKLEADPRIRAARGAMREAYSPPSGPGHPAPRVAPVAVMAIFECEVDVVRERAQRPWRVRTHHVSVAVEDRPSWVRMENEARNLAAWMCWHVRGEIVTAVRIVAVVI